MVYSLFDYLCPKGLNEFRAWTERLETRQRAKLNEKIDKLERHGDELHPHMLTDTHVPGIKKLRVQGNVKLRPLLCNGPVSVRTEYTLLMGAKEVGGKWVPKGAPDSADALKSAVSHEPKKRRTKHERVD